MKYRIKIIVFLVAIFQSLTLLSQNDKDKIELLRISFITKKIDLTNLESDKFWPLYNEYNDKIKAIRKNLRKSYQKKIDVLSEEEAEELYQLDFKTKQVELEIHKQYTDRLKGIIGVKKMLKLRLAENDFKREMLKAID